MRHSVYIFASWEWDYLVQCVVRHRLACRRRTHCQHLISWFLSVVIYLHPVSISYANLVILKVLRINFKYAAWRNLFVILIANSFVPTEDYV